MHTTSKISQTIYIENKISSRAHSESTNRQGQKGTPFQIDARQESNKICEISYSTKIKLAEWELYRYILNLWIKENTFKNKRLHWKQYSYSSSQKI